MKFSLRNIRSTVRNIEGKQDRLEFPAILGNHSGVVPTDTAGVVYVTKWNGEVLQVINRRVPNQPYAHVMVGFESPKSKILQVLRGRDVYGELDEKVQIPYHAETHQFPGEDTVWVREDQFTHLLVYPSDGMTVQIYGGIIRAYDNSGWIVVKNQTLDLTASVPSSAGAKWGLIEVDENGDASVTLSAAVGSKSLLAVGDIPDPSETPIAAVKLYYGQTEVRRDGSVSDIIDLRFGNSVGIGGGTVKYFDDLLDVDAGSPSDNDVPFYNSSTGMWELGSIDLTGYYWQFGWELDGSGGWTFVSEDDGSGNDVPVFVKEELE